MCGINGFTFPDRDLIQQMNARVKHRGPDGDGIFVADGISLGQTRLAILDLTAAAKQPMVNSAGNVAVVFNGEIYNFQALRQELAGLGYTSRSTGDTEVILHAYEAWGIDCVKRFNGIFAIAIWDARNKQLFLLRDRVGVKPLYYYWDPSTSSGRASLVFSSEIKSILLHDIPRAIDQEAFNIYFRMLYVPAPRTMFRAIRKLEPGTYLTWQNAKITQTRYWQPALTPTIHSRSETIEKIQSLMKDSVKRQLLSERPVGVFLSGGIDSTAILGLGMEAIGRPLHTFSVGFDVTPEKFNVDLDLARKTSQYYGTPHHELIVSGADCARYLPEVIYHMDEPVANATQVATYLLSRLARQDIVVALGGDGGDELFGGYERYRLSRLVSQYQQIPGFIRQLLSPLIRGFSSSAGKIDISPGVDRYLSFMAQKEAEVGRVIAVGVNDTNITRRVYAEQYFSASGTLDPENELMWADIRSWLPDESLIRSDKLSMAFALEQRVPILDHRLVELSLGIPSGLKLNLGTTKALFREAMRPYLPPHIINQPKRGWTSPASRWLRTDLLPLMREVLSPSYTANTNDLFNFPEIQKMLDEHVALTGYHLHTLWAVLTFQLWYRRFFT